MDVCIYICVRVSFMYIYALLVVFYINIYIFFSFFHARHFPFLSDFPAATLCNFVVSFPQEGISAPVMIWRSWPITRPPSNWSKMSPKVLVQWWAALSEAGICTSCLILCCNSRGWGPRRLGMHFVLLSQREVVLTVRVCQVLARVHACCSRKWCKNKKIVLC